MPAGVQGGGFQDGLSRKRRKGSKWKHYCHQNPLCWPHPKAGTQGEGMPTWHGHPTLGSFEPSQPLGWEDICPRQNFCTGQLLHSRQDQGALRRAAPPCGNPPLPGACRHQEAPIQADIPDKGACHRSCQQDEQNTHRQPPLLHSGGNDQPMGVTHRSLRG